MRKSKSNPKPADGADNAAPEPARKKSLVFPVAAALATAGASAAASFLLLPETSLPVTAKKATSAVEESPAPFGEKAVSGKGDGGNAIAKKYDDKRKSEDQSPSDAQASVFHVRGDVGVFILRPIVVTLKPQGRVRYLKVGLAIETSPDAEDAFIGNELRIIDILNGYLRAVPVSAIEDPAAMARIREQVGRRIRFVMGESPVDAVLITDFILT